ncbi:gliding motility lipoprotein GldD [Algibacter amylolyticus]|uniref:Gliding motility lipoprotein GldD n=1 Tax=Algibacter amylolyticus TaxID=1608400 RepID=A0A5M7BHG7_9FLAO|nr:gliding motility lipoprotein GldD [Algibacter amylolyticus]KAA5827828.1 gliding motility lipoprotein GldD [Algibacter amylolyticus]MBB5267057.1 gliding motility-associated lipoprotein GldD [Algibacter amylolyticus]TSJ82073.1 gliding motility lipoprotein GldD [Algibacter amylolyticus]
MIVKTKTYYLLKSLFLSFVLVLTACDEDYVPKPKAELRLDYPTANYVDANLNLPFAFEKNLLATKVESKALKSPTESYGINLEYPALKGTIFLTYKAINNDQNNFKAFLRDAQKFTLEHTKKADEIPAYPFEDKQSKVYGMLSEVKGNVASPAQFYVTDSINHFLTGSLYFYAKPNYDSILPAANYLQKDIKHIMETISWK